MPVLQRPVVARNAQHPFPCQPHFVQDFFFQVFAFAQVKIHMRNMAVRFGEGHFDVVDECAEQRPLPVGFAELAEVAETLACRPQPVPCGKVDACLCP